ncbi:MAG: hydroxymethylbilane synthase [bacterium]
MTRTYRVGTRGSALALAQTRLIVGWLEARESGARFDVVEIVTHGDRFQSTPIAQMGGRVDSGIFNTALEQAVLSGEVDFATCSFKDVESDLPDALCATTAGPRADPRDVLLSRHGTGLEALPEGAVLATSSPRRTSQLRRLRRDLKFQPLRGNVTTRVERDVARFDGVVLAGAGLLRLDLQARVTQWLEPDTLLPAAAQGALGCEYLKAREDLQRMMEGIRDPATELCVQAEKALLIELSGGCYAPIGVLATVEGGRLAIDCRIVSLDGTQVAEGRAQGDAEGPEAARQIVARLAQDLEAQGGKRIVDETRKALQADPGEPKSVP